jgi:hypothetical protein
MTAMATSRIGAIGSYDQPNFPEYIQKQVFLGTFAGHPNDADYHQESFRDLITKTNFQSQQYLYKLGAIYVYEQIPFPRYHWKVVKATIQALYSQGIGLSLKTTFFLFVAIPLIIVKGIVWFSGVRPMIELFCAIPLLLSSFHHSVCCFPQRHSWSLGTFFEKIYSLSLNKRKSPISMDMSLSKNFLKFRIRCMDSI